MTLMGREGASELRQSIKRDSKKILRHQIGKAMAVLFMVVSVLMFFTLVERICAQTLNIWGLSDLFALEEVPFDAPVVILSASEHRPTMKELRNQTPPSPHLAKILP